MNRSDIKIKTKIKFFREVDSREDVFFLSFGFIERTRSASGESARRRRLLSAAEEVIHDAEVHARQLSGQIRVVHAGGRRCLHSSRPARGVPALAQLIESAVYWPGGPWQ